ncbi:WG repeat-containing protein [Brevibacillus borstelensis]|uniref:WG repeat-containing protein n=1 Tax=Brevibacillus borstelensis TaxID=45462 RepID=UPI00203C5945|nr:WG repeat-containing protein [Brevibacillus borstelensis]MCM3557038.1 WG repeat-containing protein [Brevibacillus borstelensis]MED1853097.1 WG repeat-containing protein [Brevibacillus borstelensis]
MKKRIVALCAAAALSWNAWAVPGQAASFASIQPYITDYKIGFTNGQALVTKAVYDEFSKVGFYYTVVKNGKRGILDARTGKELTPPIWDDVEIPEQKQIAVVRNGGWFQYIDLAKKSVSKSKYAGAHTFFLSQAYPSVILMQGQTSMLLDPSGRTLIAPFAGKIEFADLAKPGKNGEEETTRYLVTTTAKQLTVYDPVTVKPMFSLPKATLAPSDGNRMPYFKVIVGGKYGLVDVNGKYVLQPQYTSVQMMGSSGFFRVQNQKGSGLWKDGRMLAEPQYAEVRVEHDMADGYVVLQGDLETYHSISSGTSFSLKKGAKYLHDGYVLGQDPTTSRYGVKRISGETVVPFEYPRLEGVPAMWLLVRSDGKKGILRAAWGKPVKDPDAWFDAVTTLGGYDLVSVTDGSKTGLYSQQKGLLVPPQSGTIVRYDSKFGRVLVQGPDGSTREYRPDGTSQDTAEPKPQRLTDALSFIYKPGEGVFLVDTASGKPISSHAYQGANVAAGGKLVVAFSAGEADLYTAEGTLLTADVKLPATHSPQEGTTVTLFPSGESMYAAGMKKGTQQQAFIRVAGGAIEALTDFVYRSVSIQPWGDRQLIALQRADGSFDLEVLASGQIAARLEQVQNYRLEESQSGLFVQKSGGWDVYSADLKQMTSGSYGRLEVLSTYSGAKLVTYWDKNTGLLGVLSKDWRTAAPPAYESIKPMDQVFPMLGVEQLPAPFVFTTKDKFGYLDANGAELFRTALLTKRPTVTYQNVTAQPFPAYQQLLQSDPLKLVDFGKPYKWDRELSGEANFFANLALYFDFPTGSGKREVLAFLTGKGILQPDPARTDFAGTDFYALMHNVVQGTSGKSLTEQQLVDWATKRGLVRERGGHYQGDIYADYHQLFFQELLKAQAGKGSYKAKPLALSALDESQRSMLSTRIIVNGRAFEQLPVPLPSVELDRHLNTLIQQYNKHAASLLQAAVKQL